MSSIGQVVCCIIKMDKGTCGHFPGQIRQPIQGPADTQLGSWYITIIQPFPDYTRQGVY